MPASKPLRKARVSRVLVVDASVVRAAGSLEAIEPVPAICRDLLQTILEVCHRACISDELREEWRRHLSRFSRTWLRSMYARRKIITVPTEPDAGLEENFLQVRGLSENEQQALIKDMHLVKAAIAYDKIIMSLDDRTHRILRKIADQNPGLVDLSWINPTTNFKLTKEWLHETAAADPAWLIIPANRPKPSRRGHRQRPGEGG